MEQDYGYPSGEVIKEILAATHQAITQSTGLEFKIELDTEEQVLKATRLHDGYHCAVHVPPIGGPAFTRTDTNIDVGDMPRDSRLKAALLIRMNDAAAEIVRGCQVEAEGLSEKPSAGYQWWENCRGKQVATLLGGGVTVHDGDILNGLISPDRLSFYKGDRRVLQVAKHLVGPAPDERLLTALWDVFNDGFTAGRLAGNKEGARDVKRAFRELLADEVIVDPEAGIVTMESEVQRQGMDWRKVLDAHRSKPSTVQGA